VQRRFCIARKYFVSLLLAAGASVAYGAGAGCLLVEHWRNTQGGTGTSINLYNPVDDRWRQLWVSPGTNIDNQWRLSGP
jgi:hypothetical protein